MARQFLLYQGEDESPSYDLTDPTSPVHVIWEEMEVGGRAFRGESDAGIIPMRDERGETGSHEDLPSGLELTSLSRGSTWEWLENAGDPDEVVMARGRIGPKDYTRGRQKADRAREVGVTTTDPNEHLQLIIVDDWVRPEETDVERVAALLADYLNGDPRPTTVIADTYVSAENPIILEAQTYDGTSPHEVMQDIALKANKNFFVTVDNELWYDAWDSTVYQSGVTISDRPDEWDFDAVCTSGSTPEVLDSGHDISSAANDNMDVTVPSGTGALYFALLTHVGVTNVTATYRANTGLPSTDQSMTLLERVDGDDPAPTGSDQESLLIFRLVNPTASFGPGGSVTIDYDGNLFGAGLGYWAVDSTANPTIVSVAGDGTGSSVTPSAGASDLVLDVVGWRIWSLGDASNDPAQTASQTLDWGVPFNNAAGQPDMAWGGANKVGTGARTWSWTTDTHYVAATITIPAAEAADGPVFGPIWDVGPASTEDGLGLRCGMRLYYGEDGAYVYHHDDVIHDRYWHAEESVYTSDPTITDSTKAEALLLAMYERRREEERTYNVSIGPLNDEQVGCIKYGQLINIKARAIPDADDQYQARRIAQLRWTTPRPGVFFARMQLSRPRKQEPYSVGPKDSVKQATTHKESGTHPASNITIIDSGAYFSGNDVEAALQELGAAGGGGAPFGWFNVKTYGATGDGTTDDTTDINSAIAALNSAGRGVLYFPAGDYLVTAGLTAITANATIRGDGPGGGTRDMTEFVSRIKCSDGGVTVLDIQSHAYTVEALHFECTDATPTAGGAIAVTVDGDHGRFRHVSIDGFYIGIDVQEGAEWSMADCHIQSPALYALKIRHVDLPDGGDWSVTNSQFIGNDRTATAGIRIESSGGGKITNCKINGTTGEAFVDGISLSVSGSTNTSVLLVANTSIENVSGDAVDITQAGTAVYSQVILNGCQVALYSNNTGKAVSIVAEDAGGISHVVIGNSTFNTDGTSRSAIQLTNADNVTLVGNELVDNFTSLYSNSGSTNITEVGGSGASDLDDLTDVTITSPEADQQVQYVGGVWVNNHRRWEPVTTNPGGGPEIVFFGDEIVMTWADYS